MSFQYHNHGKEKVSVAIYVGHDSSSRQKLGLESEKRAY